MFPETDPKLFAGAWDAVRLAAGDRFLVRTAGRVRGKASLVGGQSRHSCQYRMERGLTLASKMTRVGAYASVTFVSCKLLRKLSHAKVTLTSVQGGGEG